MEPSLREQLVEALKIDERAGLRGRGADRPRRPLGRRRRPGLPRAALPALAGRHPAAAAQGEDGPRGRRVRGDARGRHPRPPPLRLVHDLGRALRRAGGRRPERAGDQADRVPDQRRLAAGPGADRGLGARQAGGLHGGAEGALRRERQHPLGEEAGGGGRPRRLRHPRAEDPRQVHPGRPPRGRRRPPLRPHRHRQLQPEDRPPLHRLRAVHRRPGDRRRHRRDVQLPDRLRAARRATARCWSRRSTSRTGSSSEIERTIEAHSRRAARPGSG